MRTIEKKSIIYVSDDGEVTSIDEEYVREYEHAIGIDSQSKYDELVKENKIILKPLDLFFEDTAYSSFGAFYIEDINSAEVFLNYRKEIQKNILGKPDIDRIPIKQWFTIIEEYDDSGDGVYIDNEIKELKELCKEQRELASKYTSNINMITTILEEGGKEKCKKQKNK